jgi:hypothetical protein
MAEREPGFYWVRPPHDDWIVAEWTIDLGEELGDGGRWYLPANEISRPDYYFAEIGERVERPPKTPPDNDRAMLWNALTIMFTRAEEHGDPHSKKVAENAMAAFNRLNTHSQLLRKDESAWPEPQPITEAQKTAEAMVARFQAFLRLQITQDAFAKCRRQDYPTIMALLYAAYCDGGAAATRLAINLYGDRSDENASRAGSSDQRPRA